MPVSDQGRPTARVTPHPLSECFFFWALVAMALAAFAPCILLPEWRAYESLEIARQREQHRLEVVQVAIEKEERLLAAMRGDPAVIDRLAQRDLKYQRIGERIVPVDVRSPGPQVVVDGASAGEADKTFVPTAAAPPVAVSRALSLLPDLDYDRIFCDENSRTFIMCMSVALLGIAFALYGRRRPVETH